MEISGGGGGSSSSSVSKSSGSSSKSTDSSKAASSSSGSKESEGPKSTLERAASLQAPTSSSGTTTELLVGDSAPSNADHSHSVTALQSDAAKSVTGSPVDSGDSSSSKSSTDSTSPATTSAEAASGDTPNPDTPATGEPEKAAEETSELTPEQQARMDEYQQARALLDEADHARENDLAILTATPEMMNASEVVRNLEMGFADKLDVVAKAYDTVDHQVNLNSVLIQTEGPLLTDSEQQALREFTEGKTEELMPALETATAELVKTVRDPVFQEYLKDMPTERQEEFFEQMGKYAPFSEAGKAWIGELSDDLAAIGQGGESRHSEAEVAAALHEELPEDKRDALDANLGNMVGMDLVARPEGAADRLIDVAEGLGLPPQEMEALKQGEAADAQALGVFGMSVGLSYSANRAAVKSADSSDIFSQTADFLDVAEKASDHLPKLARTAQRLSGKAGKILGLTDEALHALSGSAKAFGSTVGKLSNAFSMASVAYNLSQQDYGGAAQEAMGLTGGLMLSAASRMAATELLAGVAVEATAAGGAAAVGASALAGPVAAVGYGLIGLSIAGPAMVELGKNVTFKREAIQAALGDDFNSFRGELLALAPVDALESLQVVAPDGTSPTDFFNQRVQMWDQAGANTPVQVYGFWSSLDLEKQNAYRNPSAVF